MLTIFQGSESELLRAWHDRSNKLEKKFRRYPCDLLNSCFNTKAFVSGSVDRCLFFRLVPTHKKMDQLALRIKMDDEQAFELLFRRYYSRLCVFANKFLNDPEESREIVQEVFSRIWERRSDINPDDSLKSYLFKITQNLSLTRLRKKKVETAYIEIYKLVYTDNLEFTVLDTLLGKELEINITASIGKLPSECRKVFELSRVEGLKYREIAKTLNISLKTVEAHMSKALRCLRSDLTDHLLIIAIILLDSNL